MIKLIAIDVDGTLLNTSGYVSEANKKAILKAKSEGIQVVLCTGRPLKSIQSILTDCQLLDKDDYAITYNGGVIQKTHTGQVVREINMSAEQIYELVGLATKLHMPISLVGKSDVKVIDYDESSRCLYHTINNTLTFVPYSKEHLTPTTTANKLVIAYPKEALDRAISQIPTDFYERYYIVKSRPQLLEILPKEVNKGTGLKMVSQLLEIKPHHIMSIGDMDNDIPMIQYAGTGVVMGQAPQYMKDISDYVTSAQDDDGVANAINRLALA